MSEEMSRPLERTLSPWAGFVFLALATVALYWPSVASLWARWQPDPSYSHGWLIVAISAWLVWREAHSGRLDQGRPSLLGVLALPALGLVWLVAIAGSIGVVQWLLLPALFFAAAFALYGWTALRRLWFPIGFLLFAVPIWSGLTPLLQDLTTWVVGVALMALRIPAYLDGHRVDLPSGSFEIVEGCSGAHYFVVSLTMATLYGWLWYRRLGLTLGLVGIALIVAVVANWLRVFLVIYAGYATEMQHFLVRVDHYYFGWVMFMIMIAPVFWYARNFEPAENFAAPEPDSQAGSTDVAHARPAPRTWLPFAGLALAGLAVAPLAWMVLANVETRPAPAALPAGEGGWVLTGPARSDWRPDYRGHDGALEGGYWRGEQGVDTWIVYYERPRQGEELINQSNRLAARRDGRLSVANGEAVLLSQGLERLIRYRFVVGGQVTTSQLTAKMHQVIGTLAGRPEAALLAISAPCRPDCDAARLTIAGFEADMAAPLIATIEHRGGGRNEHGGRR
jgi:exosortase A